MTAQPAAAGVVGGVVGPVGSVVGGAVGSVGPGVGGVAGSVGVGDGVVALLARGTARGACSWGGFPFVRRELVEKPVGYGAAHPITN